VKRKKYVLDIKSSARSALRALPEFDRVAIGRALTRLQYDHMDGDIKKLAGIGRWRLRVGVYRVLYKIDHGIITITVIKVEHRGSVYKGD
jgi:mRNA interferase RelE/StbE